MTRCLIKWLQTTLSIKVKHIYVVKKWQLLITLIKCWIILLVSSTQIYMPIASFRQFCSRAKRTVLQYIHVTFLIYLTSHINMGWVATHPHRSTPTRWQSKWLITNIIIARVLRPCTVLLRAVFHKQPSPIKFHVCTTHNVILSLSYNFTVLFLLLMEFVRYFMQFFWFADGCSVL